MYNNAYRPQEGASAQSGLSAYISKVFATMFIGLLVTAVAALVVATNDTLMNIVYGGNLMFVFIIAELAIVLVLSFTIKKLSYVAAQIMFYLYAIINGITLSSVFYVYELGTIYTAFFTASACFGIMAIYGSITKKDLTRIGNLLFMALIGIVISSVVNIFLGSSQLELFISFGAVAVFTGLVAYDTQKLKTYYYGAMDDYQLQRKIGIMGALSLYLDFINIFLQLLRIFGSKRD